MSSTEYCGTWALIVKTRLEGSEFYISMRVTLPASSFVSTDHIQAAILQPADESGIDSRVHGFVLGNQLCDDRHTERQANGCSSIHRSIPIWPASRIGLSRFNLGNLRIPQPLRSGRPDHALFCHSGGVLVRCMWRAPEPSISSKRHYQRRATVQTR